MDRRGYRTAGLAAGLVAVAYGPRRPKQHESGLHVRGEADRVAEGG